MFGQNGTAITQFFYYAPEMKYGWKIFQYDLLI